jgi:serine phosphatase RsbU (regulator of sigma subunit)
MNTLSLDVLNIVNSLFISSVGLAAIVLSLFRLRTRDFSILNFGLFCFIYGFRGLIQTPSIQSIAGFPFTNPYFITLLTYLDVIPFTAFFINIFGRGVYDSLIWVFRSYIIYFIAAVIYDLFFAQSLPSNGINPFLVVIWCLVLVFNIFFTKKQSQIELLVMRIVLLICVAGVIHDNLINLHLLPWQIHITDPCFLILCAGLGFVAGHHFLSTEKKLLAIEQEVEIARQIQNSNIPTDFRPPIGIEIAARYVPMSMVAGDFYDILTRENEGIGILIADVCGHGVGAALIGSMLKIAFASQTEHLADPAKVLTEINRILQGKIENSFVTAGYFFIHNGNRKISYSIAGHPPALLWRRTTKELIKLSANGTILGPFPDAVYENAEFDITKGDRLVLYTDGIIEAKNSAGSFFGDELFETFIVEHSFDSAEQTSELFLKHLSRWSGKSVTTSYDDDLTLLVIDVIS